MKPEMHIETVGKDGLKISNMTGAVGQYFPEDQDQLLYPELHSEMKFEQSVSIFGLYKTDCKGAFRLQQSSLNLHAEDPRHLPIPPKPPWDDLDHRRHFYTRPEWPYFTRPEVVPPRQPDDSAMFHTGPDGLYQGRVAIIPTVDWYRLFKDHRIRFPYSPAKVINTDLTRINDKSEDWERLGAREFKDINPVIRLKHLSQENENLEDSETIIGYWSVSKSTGTISFNPVNWGMDYITFIDLDLSDLDCEIRSCIFKAQISNPIEGHERRSSTVSIGIVKKDYDTINTVTEFINHNKLLDITETEIPSGIDFIFRKREAEFLNLEAGNKYTIVIVGTSPGGCKIKNCEVTLSVSSTYEYRFTGDYTPEYLFPIQLDSEYHKYENLDNIEYKIENFIIKDLAPNTTVEFLSEAESISIKLDDGDYEEIFPEDGKFTIVVPTWPKETIDLYVTHPLSVISNIKIDSRKADYSEYDKTLIDKDEYYDVIYLYAKGGILKITGLENPVPVSIDEVLQETKHKTNIKLVKKFYFNWRNLECCYQSYAKRVFEELINSCPTDNDLIYKRDFVWMTFNIIKYLVSMDLYLEAERLLKRIEGCNGFCSCDHLKHESHGNKGCGCSKS